MNLRVLGVCGVFAALLVSGCGDKTPAKSPVFSEKPPVNLSPANATQEELPLDAKFSDSTKAAGLDFIQSDGSCGMRYFVEQVAAGATVFDANGDGSPDIYFPAPKGIGVCSAKPGMKDLHQRLYLNDGRGHFTLKVNAFPTETAYGIAGVAGDYDNDGKIDLYVACFGKNTLYHNNGDGTFADVTKKAGVAVGGFSTGGVWFDYDGDGRLDLYVLRYCEWTVETDIVCPGPNGQRDACNPNTYTPARNKLFHNNGDGTFTDVTEKSKAAPEKRRGLSAIAFDFDNDGKLDLLSPTIWVRIICSKIMATGHLRMWRVSRMWHSVKPGSHRRIWVPRLAITTATVISIFSSRPLPMSHIPSIRMTTAFSLMSAD